MLLFLGITWSLSGCKQGPELGEVTGKVTLNEQPVEGARVTFQPLAGGPSSFGETDSDGYFELQFAAGDPGAVLGEHRISIETFRVSVDGEGNAIEIPETLPARYNVESELSREVAAGTQRFDFALQSEGVPPN